jgi:hypothetical protein
MKKTLLGIWWTSIALVFAGSLAALAAAVIRGLTVAEGAPCFKALRYTPIASPARLRRTSASPSAIKRSGSSGLMLNASPQAMSSARSVHRVVALDSRPSAPSAAAQTVAASNERHANRDARRAALALNGRVP